MIATCHILAGAMAATRIQAGPLGLVAALLSHYLLDMFPHAEYNTDKAQRDLRKKQWKKNFSDYSKVALDLLVGVFLVLIFTDNIPLALAGGFLGILPDIFIIITLVAPNNRLLKAHYNFHQKLHFSQDKKVSGLLSVGLQSLTVVLVIYLL